MAEWSARRTRNPVVSGSSLTLATWWICSRFSRYGGHMWHQKHRPLFVFLSFNAIHFKFCNNIEFTIPKKRMLFVFQILAFLAGNDVTTFPPNFVFSIMGYLIMVSERSHHKDVKRKKNWNIPFYSKYIAFWKCNFPPCCTKFSFSLWCCWWSFFYKKDLSNLLLHNDDGLSLHGLPYPKCPLFMLPSTLGFLSFYGNTDFTKNIRFSKIFESKE